MTSVHLFQCDDNGVCIVPPHSSGSLGSHVTVHSNVSCEREVAVALGTSGTNLQWIVTHLPKEVVELAKKLEQNRLQILG